MFACHSRQGLAGIQSQGKHAAIFYGKSIRREREGHLPIPLLISFGYALILFACLVLPEYSQYPPRMRTFQNTAPALSPLGEILHRNRKLAPRAQILSQTQAESVILRAVSQKRNAS